MPKNKNSEVTCMNHLEIKLAKQKELAVMQAYEKN